MLELIEDLPESSQPITSPRLIPARNSIRLSGGVSAFLSTMPRWISMAQRMASTTLANLGKMLVRGLSIEEIARRLRRDKVEVRDKIAEVGQACR